VPKLLLGAPSLIRSLQSLDLRDDDRLSHDVLMMHVIRRTYRTYRRKSRNEQPYVRRSTCTYGIESEHPPPAIISTVPRT